MEAQYKGECSSSREDKHILSFPRLGKEGRLNLETVPSGVKGNLNLRGKKKKKPQLAEVKATSALMVMT